MIAELKSRVPITFLCRHFDVSRSSFYSWRSRPETPRLVSKKGISEEIKRIFKNSKSSYGSPRIYKELKANGISVSENTVASYMQEMGLDARLKKKYKVQTTDSKHSKPIAPRLFKVEEEHSIPEHPGRLLAGDITYLRLGNSFLYLAVVMDLYNREIVGWSMSESLEKTIVLNALSSAMKKLGPDSEVIFHSDRGSQYAATAYRNLMKEKNVIPSMSRKGNCYDNAYVESWFSSLKKECIYRQSYSTKKELRQLVFRYIESWYNKKRRHSALGYLSPEEYKLTNQAG